MREIKTQIEISAPPATVWKLLSDFENWSNWNTTASASGEATLGSSLTITMGTPNGKGHAYKAVITEFNEPENFRWRAKMMAGFLMTNDRIVRLEAKGAGTQLTHIETFSGLLVPLFWSKMKEGVPNILNQMNEALKSAAEKA